MNIKMDQASSDDVPGVLYWDDDICTSQWIRINMFGFKYVKFSRDIRTNPILFNIIGVDEI